MQPYKATKNNSELEIIGIKSEQLTSSLTSVIEKFELKRFLSIFDVLKSKGIAISGLLKVLLILPFYSVATINQLMRCGLNGREVEGKKQVYYDVKNNENIDWRKLLIYCAKRYLYLICHRKEEAEKKITALMYDDATLNKTGKKIERVSMVHDHVSGGYVLGFKLLVEGFWDGENFIPLDFSLHRERGKRQEKYQRDYRKALHALKKQEHLLQSLRKSLQKKQASYRKYKSRYEANPTNTNKKLMFNSIDRAKELGRKLKQAEKEMSRLRAENNKAYNALKRFYYNGKLFGLSKKEREAQFQKAVSVKSHGFKRRKESDKSKIDCMLAMLGRAVARGIIPDYVLVDSWFFCYELLAKLQRLKKGAIRLVAMAKINRQTFLLCENDKEMSAKNILKTHERNVKRCRKLKAQYIKVPCFYKGIRLNLFYVRMGKCKTWRLLVTTDLGLSFIRLMEVYQIRWSIEVFFKDCKQHLHLADCQSNTFDAQIADITLSMIQYIILTYYKRINYQKTIGGLFENIAKELEELNLISRLLDLFWELIETICNIGGIDFFELQQNMVKDDTVMEQFTKLLPQHDRKERA